MPTFTWRLLDQGPTRYGFDNPENHASERGSSIDPTACATGVVAIMRAPQTNALSLSDLCSEG